MDVRFIDNQFVDTESRSNSTFTSEPQFLIHLRKDGNLILQLFFLFKFSAAPVFQEVQVAVVFVDAAVVVAAAAAVDAIDVVVVVVIIVVAVIVTVASSSCHCCY